MLSKPLRRLSPRASGGSANVADIIAGLATQMGLVFENNGVGAQLSNRYLWGSPRKQAYDAAKNADLEIGIENRVLAF